MHPKITIITPSYNQGQYIEECILSVLDQNYPNLEFIIVDGGSDDSTLEILNRYSNYFAYCISEKDNGQSHAINKGIVKASGEIITWLNSDDLLLPNSLEIVAKGFSENPNVGLIHGNAILFGQNQKESIIKIPEYDLKERYLAYIPFPQPSSFFRKEILNVIGNIDESLHFGMDYDLLARIALNYEILQIQTVLSKYRLHNESKTNSSLSFANDWSIVFSRVLRSVTDSEFAIEVLKSVNLYHDSEEKYVITKIPSNLKLSLLYFLNMQMHYYYITMDLDTVSKLASLIKQLDENFYKKEKVNNLFIKAKILNPMVIRFLRTFTR
ncbi:MAG: glycosyltransferase [Bacteroidetes bacterium]|nr:glycosyltransferase [Bacteroidota bacterium]